MSPANEIKIEATHFNIIKADHLIHMAFLKRTSGKILIIVFLWILFLAIDLLKKNNLDVSSSYFWYYYLGGFGLWILLTFLLIYLFNWSSRFILWKRILFLILLGIVIGSFKVYINRLGYYGIMRIVDDTFQSTSWINAFKSFGRTFFYMEAIIICWVILIILYLVEISNKYKNKSLEAAQLESELANAKLQALRMQIHPHFLFNAHNAIATLLRSQQNKQALEMLLKLSELLRVSMNNFTDQFVSLKEEINFINNYLEIEKVRFEDTLKVNHQIEEKVLSAKVPVFILQPLVENAIKHGVSKNLGESLIALEIFRKKEELILRVFNTSEMTNLPDSGSNNGIGLSNLRNRLSTLFGTKATLKLYQRLEGVEASLSIPYEES